MPNFSNISIWNWHLNIDGTSMSKRNTLPVAHFMWNRVLFCDWKEYVNKLGSVGLQFHFDVT